VRQHFPRSLEVGNDAIEHRRDHSYTTRFAPVLLFCFVTDVDHLASDTVHCNQRWFVDNYAAFTKNTSFRTALMVDGLHPNDAGYAVLGQSFYDAISALLRPVP